MIENSQHGLTLLAPDHEVVATREEHHQQALAPWAPRGDGRPRRVAVELRFARITHGSHAGRSGLEILLEGQRVGELTLRMSERYAPHVEQVQRRGGRAGCVAMVIHGRRGVEVELRLPDAAAVPAPLPRPVPVPGPSTRPVPSGPGAGGRGAGGRGPNGPGGGPTPRRNRKPLWVGAGVATALLVIGMNVGSSNEAVPAAAPTIDTATTTTRSTVVAPLTADAAATSTPSAPRPVAPAAAATTSRRTAAPAESPESPPRAAPQPAARPAPTTAPEPDPEPEAQPEPEPDNVYYANCAAVRAAGRAPIRVGDPGYSRDLDRDGDGQGCGGD